MKIIKLTARNVRAINVVEITPDGDIVTITGKNGAGKSSVLDAVAMAIGGGELLKDTRSPIRDGENEASAEVDLGDLIVRRTWKRAGDRVETNVKLLTKEGASHSGPQGHLNRLAEHMAFDPYRFASLPAKEQLDKLLDVVNLPFDPAEIEQRRKTLTEQRATIGREGKQAEGHLAGLPIVPAGTPDAEVSSAALFADLQAAQDVHAERERTIRAAEATQSARERAEQALAVAQEALARAQAEDAKALAAARALPDLPDTSEIGDRIATVDQVNAAVRAKAERTRVAALVADAKARYAAKTAALDALAQEKEDGLAAAVLPYPDLGFDTDGLTWKGRPFSDASTAEKTLIAAAICIALDPELKVLFIRDGSLLDRDLLKRLCAMVSAAGFQLWIERVEDDADGAFLIQDGSVLVAEDVA